VPLFSRYQPSRQHGGHPTRPAPIGQLPSSTVRVGVASGRSAFERGVVRPWGPPHTNTGTKVIF
jgi:hypothetical protein